MEVYKLVTEVLEREGVDTVFSLMSSDIMGITSELKNENTNGIEVIEARHEQQAVAMADGYARTNDDVGICVVGRGPAIAQTGTGLVTARKQGSPLMVITATSSTTDTRDRKGFEQESFLESTIGDVINVQSADAIIQSLFEAFRKLRAGRGPLAIQIAEDVLYEEVSDNMNLASKFGTKASGVPQAPRIDPGPDRITEAIELLLDADASKPPVLLVGWGVIESDERHALVSLAERMGAIIVTTLRANGYFSDHPYAAGFVGTYGRNLANQLLSETDLVVALGASLNEHTTDHGRLFADNATIIQIDEVPYSIGRYTSVDLEIVGDAMLVAKQFVEKLDEAEIDFSEKFWTDKLAQNIAKGTSIEQSFPAATDRIDPRTLVEHLDEILPAERTIVSDNGHFCFWMFDGFEFSDPKQFVWPVEFAAIGLGLAAGIGAEVGNESEDRTTIAFCGDAGLMMSLQEIETAVRHDIPLIVVVMNDDALGAEFVQLRDKRMDETAAILEAPDFADIAASFGADGYTVRSEEDIEEFRDNVGQKPGGVVVLDCKVNREVVHERFL